ncbi:MAG: ATP-binding protein [Cytophagales bacterium]|nr:adenine nucleotide alpha hydrolase [Bernardetiaceae bacterium]MDW8206030.1 ATP-binding protein [Cytophagales bacterium]
MQKVFLSWSSGKDSALALHYLLKNKTYEVACLLTTVNAHFQRVSMHGLRNALLYQQIAAIGLPLETVELPENPDNLQYETLMGKKLQELHAKGIQQGAFGDIFLEDLKKYREKQLAALNMKPIFPLWKKDSTQLINEFLDLGFKAITVCVNASLLDQSFVGRVIDREFISELPASVDPCGENGEFHTFCFDGYYFKNLVPFAIGETVYREYVHGGVVSGFWFCDLQPLP